MLSERQIQHAISIRAKLISVAVSNGVSRDDAHDVVQHVYVKSLTNDSVVDDEGLTNYLIRAVINRVLEIKKQRSRRKTSTFTEVDSFNPKTNKDGRDWESIEENIPSPLSNEEFESIQFKIAELRKSTNPQTKRIACYVEQFILGEQTIGRTHMWRILNDFRELYHGKTIED